MKITQEEVNFFKTFGYLRLKNVFSSTEVSCLDRYFSSYYTKFFQESFLGIKIKAILKGITCMVPSFADNQPEMMSLFLKKGLFDIPKQILGESVQYWGSDGSLFAYGSLWHRDTATLANRLKMNIYLNSGGKNTGAFRIIPGSQKMGDEYANNLSLACSWPGSSFAGGMSETKYLPTTLSPRLNPIARIFNRKLADIPHQVIEFNVGDVLIFDDRALHCVYRPLYPKVRKLITLLFNEMSVNDRVHISQKMDMTSTSINDELRTLKQLECNQYNVPCYGAGVSEMFDKYNYSSYLSMLSDIAPNRDSDYKGKHVPQSEDLAKFLTKNYFD